MASDLSMFSSSSFSANQAFTASEQDSSFCRSAVNDEVSNKRRAERRQRTDDDRLPCFFLGSQLVKRKPQTEGLAATEASKLQIMK